MSQDYQALDQFPIIKTFTSSSTTCTEILLPSDCNQVTVCCNGAAFKVGQNGQTDGVAMTSDNIFVLSQEKFKMKIGKGRNRSSSLFIQADSLTPLIVVMLEEVL